MLTETEPLDDDRCLPDADALPPKGRGRWPKRHPLAGTIPYAEALVCWTPLSEASTHRSTAGQVVVMPYPDRSGRSEAYAYVGGGADITDPHFNSRKAITEALRLFNTIVLRDGIRARTVHAAMVGIEEYRLALDPEVPGAHRGHGRPRHSNADLRGS